MALVGTVGPINLLEPCVTLAVAGPSREFQQLDVVIDTGFSGWLTLPRDLVAELDLTRYGNRASVLATGERVPVEIYSALVMWGGQIRPVFVHEMASGRPLIGTAMLENYRLTIDMHSDGLVDIGLIP